MSVTLFTKDPSAVLDFGFDWSSWLATGETIESAVWTVPAGLTKGSSSISGAVTVIWLSGGDNGTNHRVTCRITTSQGRVDERSFVVTVNDR
jgi:hypothetical protein